MQRTTLVLAALVLGAAGTAAAQQTHVIRMDGNAEREEYTFAPATVTAKAGDILVFRVAGGGNHGVTFESSMPAAARTALNGAMPRRVGDLSGPLLARGGEYRITIPAGMPAGRYRFYCLPHRAYDEVGFLVIE
jgi:plastocyanin